ncbi:histidine kinase [Aggregicoccus sp. 17bor-14]|uniref:sensor histidine kinase n=1 Tax=Myxococcaceae TaxID=31 RepID=UPI00129C3AC1|nr:MULTISPECIES: histidine kinase [Myxococcaceae]MBF5041636.1 histidine kinase [Simulacricoccus sp. 17bor-14]MRI87420.1 histidine kinase [Aggregicoccus sp. 17bor-14]
MGRGQRWAVFAGLTLLVAAAVTGTMVLGSTAPLAAAAPVFALSIFYGAFIGFPMMGLLPAVGQRVGRMAPARGLFTMMAACVGLAALSMLVATGTLAGLGVIPRAQVSQRLLNDGLLSVLLALPMSVGAFAYSRMVGRLQEAQRRRARAEALTLEARFSSLSARLQPHFLFNTLNSIAALVREDPRAAEHLVERLSALLRGALDASHAGPVPLQRELDLVQDYLDIEQVRLGARLRSRVEVEPGCEALRVPPFTLQTLVENAVKYAVAPRREGGEVQVRARQERGALQLEVVDDGPGFGGPPPSGHGLDMLAQRLDTAYGEAASVRVERRAEGGARVCVRLPAERAE